MQKPRITIIVSTVDCKILSNRKLLSTTLNKNLQMLVVNQKVNNEEDLVLNIDWTTVINTSSKGLSKSRNIALDEVKSGLAVIADDDVIYVEDFEIKVRDSFQEFNNYSIITFRIETPEGTFFKDYEEEAFQHNLRSLLKVSSIDMVLNIDRIGTKLRFDESFGLGAQFNTGENNIFLLDALKKGFLMGYSPKTIVIHPFENSGRILDAKHLHAKGAVFRRMFKLRGIIVLVLFCIKKRNEMKNSKLSLFNGVFKGIQGFCSYNSK